MWTMTPFSAKSSDILPTLLKMPEALIKGEEKANEQSNRKAVSGGTGTRKRILCSTEVHGIWGGYDINSAL